MSFIYNDLQNVTVHFQPNDEKECVLRVTVEIINKGFDIKITDDNDPTVLFNLILSEEDYSALKNQQGLRVDFENFPKEFANLLGACKTRERHYRLVLGDVEIYETTFKSRPGCFLKLIERNTFNDKLCHLSLPLAPGTDSDIKKHLCKKISLLRNLLADEQRESANLQEQNNGFLKECSEKNKRITELEVRLAEETSAIRLEQSHQLVAENEKHSKKRLSLEAEHQRNVQNLQSNIELLRHKNSVLLEAKLDLESKLQVVTMEKDTALKDLNRVSSTNLELKMNTSTMERKIINLDQHLAGLQNRVEAAESARQEKSAALNQAVWELKTAQEREKAMCGKLNECERRMQLHVNQIGQANKEVAHLSAELTSKQNKMAKLLSVVGILEKELESVQKELKEKSKILSEIETVEVNYKDELDKLKIQITELEKLTKEQEATIKRQIDVNTCLHRKLNERDGHSASATEITSGVSRVNFSNLASNRTLPPWLTSSACEQERDGFASSKNAGNADKRKPALDPSIFLPTEADKPRQKHLTAGSSAYFPKSSA